MSIKLPSLPYDYGALEPYLDARTMEIHHTKHHGGYVSNLNKLLEGREELAKLTLEEILRDIRVVPEEIRQGVRNHGGGHLNHSLFWQIMAPGRGGEPDGRVRDAIASTFTSFSGFKDKFTSADLTRFGSGWAWLGVNTEGRLEIISTPNQDSPLMLGLRPILGIDVWEHAYYLKYQNRRADYLAAWWNVVNWPRVAEFYTRTLEVVGGRK